MESERFPAIVRHLYELVNELETMFPGRHFTPDGHLVGSLGEVWASHRFGIELASTSSEGHDGRVGDKSVQIKTTQRDRIAITSKPDYLLVLSLSREGSFRVRYNGPGAPVWALVADKPRPKNGQYQVSLGRLDELSQRQTDGPSFPQVRY